MRLWRIARADRTALDGEGARLSGGRYSSPGHAIVGFASEPGLAVLISLRYVREDAGRRGHDHVLGWTQCSALPDRVPDHVAPADRRAWVDDWAASNGWLLVAMPSAVLPEADVILMNASHPAAAGVPPLVTRPFSFAACLHRPPALDLWA